MTSLILVIDAYNVLRSPESSFRGSAGKKALHKSLATYLSSSGSEIDRVILVYDGGSLHYPERERSGKLETVLAGYKQSADDWIIDFVRKTSGTIVVVTDDAELGRFVFEHRGDVMMTEAFALLLRERQLAIYRMDRVAKERQLAPEKKRHSDLLIEYSHRDLPSLPTQVDSVELRELMESGTAFAQKAAHHKDDGDRESIGKPEKKSPKGLRKLVNIIKKL